MKDNELLNLIGVEDCSYQTLEEFREDPEHRLSDEQKFRFECIEQIALELHLEAIEEKTVERGIYA